MEFEKERGKKNIKTSKKLELLCPLSSVCLLALVALVVALSSLSLSLSLFSSVLIECFRLRKRSPCREREKKQREPCRIALPSIRR